MLKCVTSPSVHFNFASNQFEKLESGGQSTALIGSNGRLSWSQLVAQVCLLENRFRQMKFDSHRPFVIYGHKELGMVLGILACWRLKIPYIPVDRMMPDSRVQKIQEISNAQFRLDARSLELEKLIGYEFPNQDTVENLAYIIFTSGSTGEPKGVQITRENVLDLASWIRSKDFSFGPHDAILSQCSFSFDVSLFDVLACMQFGATLILSGPADLETKPVFRSKIPDVGPTVWSSTPSFLSLALASADFTSDLFPSLQKFYVAGEAVHSELTRRLWRKFPNAELWNAYGPTEATVITTLINVTPEIVDRYPLIPIGKVKPGVQMPTLAKDGVSEAELCIVGPNVSPGYLNRADLNGDRFLQTPNGRLYRTGDIGFHQDGYVFCKGRLDNQIKLHGYRIELDEIDNIVSSVECVRLAATVPLKRNGDVKKLVCFVELNTQFVDHDWSEIEETIRVHVGAELPYYMVPSEFRQIARIPYNANHKVDRRLLLEQLT